MAEIKIEKKSPIWPWILLILALIAIIVYFVYNNDNDMNTTYDNDTRSEARDSSSTFDAGYGTTTPYMGANSAVEEFENSVLDSSRIAVDSTYTKTAIVNLAKVVTLKADELDMEPSLALENLKFYSGQDPVSTDTEIPGKNDIYNNFKTVSKDIVTVLESIQSENYPSLEEDVKELKQTSSKIENNIATQEQQTTVQTFFAKAKEVVNNMDT